MPRLNLEEKTLVLNIINDSKNINTAKIARILSEKTGRQIDPSIVRRVLRKNNIEINSPGRPRRVDDIELERCFKKYYHPKSVYITHAAEKTAKELGYALYTSVLYRWREMGLI
ncbi:MAG: hypothetical protein AABX84_03165 [Nanoarchaeota archaeon]